MTLHNWFVCHSSKTLHTWLIMLRLLNRLRLGLLSLHTWNLIQRIRRVLLWLHLRGQLLRIVQEGLLLWHWVGCLAQVMIVVEGSISAHVVASGWTRDTTLSLAFKERSQSFKGGKSWHNKRVWIVCLLCHHALRVLRVWDDLGCIYSGIQWAVLGGIVGGVGGYDRFEVVWI